MKKAVDMFGNEIKIGQILLYPVTNSSSVSMKLGVVSAIRVENQHWYDHEKQEHMNGPCEYVLVDKYIDMTRTFWQGDGDMNQEIPEEAVFDHEYVQRDYYGKPPENITYKIYKIEKFDFKKYRLEGTDNKQIINYYQAEAIKCDDPSEPYMKRSIELSKEA